ncbi:hypothetical protein [Flavobacterium sp.]|uniref:hypothetical protein n=1 Tax=Flavobacterium sp. TaxID=239 RepID=UPI0039E41443
MENKIINMETVTVFGEKYAKITNADAMRPFFMSIVSDSDHWMFISSNGGLSAGRKNAEFSLFPYYTDDKITESAEITGSKSIFRVKKDGNVILWEPFSIRQNGKYSTTRNVYKNVYGNKVVFEEINNDLGLTFRYQWSSSNLFGFVKTSELINHSGAEISVELIDGLQNILPAAVGSDLQRASSNLVDAYKRSELHASTGLGIFALSAIIVDKAEPSEALKANITWSLGLQNPSYLVSSLQLDHFRKGNAIHQETDVKGEKGAYFVHTTVSLANNETKSWQLISNVNLNQNQVIEVIDAIESNQQLKARVQEDIEVGTQNLIRLNATADGLQFSNDHLKDTRHFSNTLFNIMRGGIFDFNYQIEKADFVNYIKKANANVYNAEVAFFNQLPEAFDFSLLKNQLQSVSDANLQRLASEYLPLKFSRRHGDPSRPWNKFSINTRNETDGSKILDYEGNWRDIFQNWEALAHSFPLFMEGMLFKFLNATTFDGYNPYRITKGGFDWETIEPDDPWSYIGYWGDHQIIYLLKFLEFTEHYFPGKVQQLLDNEVFVYAAVPYRIKAYQDILQNPKDTIDFDHHWDTAIRKEREIIGADGALLKTGEGQIYQVNFIEKIMATVLSKMSNLIPEGGIWMNTQRPEWNDANNALVGNGVSMVTLYYLRRFLKWMEMVLEQSNLENIKISNEMVEFYHAIREVLEENQTALSGTISDAKRKSIMDALGKAASDYRLHIYQNGFWGKKRTVSLEGLKRFTKVSLLFLEQSIRQNERTDHLYHAYNLMSVDNNEVKISYLSEMLEGQVAVLTSEYLSSKQASQVLDALKSSALFRPDQYSYLLYPNKALAGFLERNNIPEPLIMSSDLLKMLLQQQNKQIILKDVKGGYHFHGNFKNANDLAAALDDLAATYGELVKKDRTLVLSIFEKVFHHKAFTGRSGTFYAYEGLGSIYWHMVSKLLLAVTECCLKAIEDGESDELIGKLLDHYYEIQAGIGVHKSPELYGAFPTDPYSHTPWHKGAQQPGMTGQVKEDLLSRMGELGIIIKKGLVHFEPKFLRIVDFTKQSQTIEYVKLNGAFQTMELPAQSLFFTYCQVPIMYQVSEKNQLLVNVSGTVQILESHHLTSDLSQKLFGRTDEIESITVCITRDRLKN